MTRSIALFGAGLLACGARGTSVQALPPARFAARVTADSAIFTFPMTASMLPSAPRPDADPRFGIAWSVSWKGTRAESRCAQKCVLGFVSEERLGPEPGLEQLERLLRRGERRFDVWIPGSYEVALDRAPALRLRAQPWGVHMVLPASPPLTELLAAKPDSAKLEVLVGPAGTTYSAWVRLE